MTVISKSAPLAEFCDRLSRASYITVDTEFMRENTYWSKLCLVQLAGPDEAAAIDVLAQGIDLAPLYDLLHNPKILKVFHAARQDVEIFVYLTGKVPAPLFDTQIAAMVCGFGASVGYQTLAEKLAGARIDKSSRFTDWSRRPLTERQVRYALEDVTHLRTAYEKLAHQLEQSGREPWLEEEMAILTDPATYAANPEDAWRRLKVRSTKPRFLGVLKEVSAWRENEAKSVDVPRNRILRDEALLEIAAHRPKTKGDLVRVRGMGKGLAEGRRGAELLKAIERGENMPESELPRVEPSKRGNGAAGPVVDLLKVLLKIRSEDHGVAQKMIANVADLERIASLGDADVPALRGWRRDIFGDDALALKRGELAFALRKDKIVLIELPAEKTS
ncbi:MAG: ribonuclease D [Proteobacteria bacterium]|nr:ribonuclease D [Pseudomonadota bacterium]